MSYTLTLQDITQVTPDTYQLTFNRPDDFEFEAGQASELTILKPELKEEGRPFTMTSRPNDPYLEFVIKSYPDHNGVTAEIPHLTMTDQVKASDPFGAITDHGPGVFVAGGAGITPFISILRKHQEQGEDVSQLIFANETPDDIIFKETWESMARVDETFVVAKNAVDGLRKGHVDQPLLKELITETDQPFYLCGPGKMVDDVRASLQDMGINKDRIITEEGW